MDAASKLVTTVRSLLADNQLHVARSLAVAARREADRATGGQTGGADLERIGMALVMHRSGLAKQAWARLRPVGPELLRRHLPVEALEITLGARTPAAVDRAREIVAAPAEIPDQWLPAVCGRLLVAGEPDLARAVAAEARRRDLDLGRLEPWLDPWINPPAQAAPAGSITIGILDARQPAESGPPPLGDILQAQGLLTCLARFRAIRFSGEAGLAEVTGRLQGRIRPDQVVEAEPADVHLLPVSRGFSRGEDLPAGTLVVVYGGQASQFGLTYGLPLHPNARPLFLGLHLGPLKTLTDEVLDYLRAHGPVGCRDWATVDVLLAAGVDAFFSGCLSTTVDAAYPLRVSPAPDLPVAAIDTPVAALRAARPVQQVSHRGLIAADRPLAESVNRSIDLVASYQERYHRIVTSRLQPYLAALAVGVPARLAATPRGAGQYDGLAGLEVDSPELKAMQATLRDLLTDAVRTLLTDPSPTALTERWRKLTAPLVAEAKARAARPAPRIPATVDVAGTVAQIHQRRRELGPADGDRVDVCVALDQNLVEQLPVTLESLTSNASRPLRIWVLCRGLSTGYQDRLAAAFGDQSVVFLPFDGVEYGEITRMLAHITVSTMDRLLLPDLLPDLDRIIYLDIDTVTEGDICELASLDLAGFPLAARDAPYSQTQAWRTAAALLPPERASELRRTMLARHGFDHHNFNAGVLVLDLARMRADDFVGTYLPMVGEYGLNDQDVLNAYVGGRRARLDARWNALPVLEEAADGGVIHFAGGLKPWGTELTPYQDRWQKYADQFAARTRR